MKSRDLDADGAQWVRDLVADSAGMVLPSYQKSAFAPPLLSDDALMQLLAVALATIRGTPGGDRSLLVHDEFRGLRPIARDHVLATPPEAGERFEAWWTRVFSGERMLMTLSELDRFMDERLMTRLAELYDVIGIPSGEISAALICSNLSCKAREVTRIPYPTLQIPLFGGPGVFHVTNPDLEWRPAPGDLVYTPPGLACGDKGDDLSATLVISWRDSSAQDFILEAVTKYIVDFMVDPELLTGPDPVDANSEHLNALLLSRKLRAVWSDSTQRTGVAQALKMLRLELLSSRGFRSLPKLRDPISIDLVNRAFRRTRPFELYDCSAHDGQVAVFARGRRILALECEHVAAAIQRLNDGQTVLLQELSAGAPDAAKTALVRLFGDLWAVHAIEEVRC